MGKPSRLGLGTALGTAGLLVSLGTGGGAAAAAVAASGRPAAGASRLVLQVGGLERTARVYVPRHLPAAPPLVLVLHGGFGTGTSAARQGGWDEMARRHGFVAVYPDGINRSWNAGGCCGAAMRRNVDDIGFLTALIDRVQHDRGTDHARVFVTGISNGGMMAYRLACEASGRVAAIAPVSATLAFGGCNPVHPVSLLHIHGLADGNVPFAGGRPTSSFQVDPPAYPPVRDGIDRFVSASGCAPAPQPSTGPDPRVTTQRWESGAGGTAVELVTIADGGHSWPGGRRLLRALDPPSDALDATQVIWWFFAAHPRAGA
jgi:polyhydroxybutyrate depolymerase